MCTLIKLLIGKYLYFMADFTFNTLKSFFCSKTLTNVIVVEIKRHISLILKQAIVHNREQFLSASNPHNLAPRKSSFSPSFSVFQVGNSQGISPSQLCLHSLSFLPHLSEMTSYYNPLYFIILTARYDVCKVATFLVVSCLKLKYLFVFFRSQNFSENFFPETCRWSHFLFL
jgi:hypothetical protein